MMVKALTGLIGTVLVVAFLGYYAISLNSIPLWIIVISVLTMVVAEYVESLRT
jgi:hypothetical protein